MGGGASIDKDTFVALKDEYEKQKATGVTDEQLFYKLKVAYDAKTAHWSPFHSAFDIVSSSQDCFKATIKELEALLPSNDKGLLTMAWEAYQRSFSMHESMEVNLYAILEEHSSDCQGLRDLISNRHQLSSEITQLIKSHADNSQLSTPFTSWKETSLTHFDKEHELLVQVHSKLPDPKRWALIINEKLISPALLSNSVELENFVGWCAAKLSNHGSSIHVNEEALEVYLLALRAACGSEQWLGLLPTLQKHCKESIWNGLVEKHQIDTDAPGF